MNKKIIVFDFAGTLLDISSGVPDQLCDNTPEILKSLSEQGHTLCLNTSSPQAQCERVLSKYGVFDCFDFLATIELSINKREKFQIIAGRYGVECGDLVFITDTVSDVMEAESMKVPTIAVTWGMATKAEFTKAQPQNLLATIDRPSEIQEHFK